MSDIGRALVFVLVLFAAVSVVGTFTNFFRFVVADSGHPPMTSEQVGPRGTGLVQIYNPRVTADLVAANAVPTSVPYAGDEGAMAGDVYENVKVLGDVSAGEFTRLMVNITSWVAEEEGCAGCHNVDNFADDSLYTKVVARRMLEMVRDVNANWTAHVGETGITCYTCHRGQLVPPNIWFNDPGPTRAGGFTQKATGQNHPAPAAGMSALPRDPMTAYLEGDTDVRVQSATPRASGDGLSIKDAERTYALMMHMSQALGVNCDYCHNTRAMRDWWQSTPQRVRAWHGIRMARDLNNRYLNPLKSVLPAHRLGEAKGDAPKVNCATCHNGVFKPLFGAQVARLFPALKGVPANDAGGGRAAAAPPTDPRVDAVAAQ